MPRKRNRFPAKHLRTTPAAWRQLKRQQWKRLMNALAEFTMGSAYTPVHSDLYDLQRFADRIAEDLEGDWIAW